MILVTGGTGLLGSYLINDLLQKGCKIRAIKRKNSNLGGIKNILKLNQCEHLFNQIEWFDTDILDKEGINESMIGIDKVYHAAAMISFYPLDRDKMIENNVKGTANIVNAALINNISKLCHVSSISALGSGENGSFITEQSFRNPKGKFSGYSISKFYSENEVWRGVTEGLKAVIVNPSIILGSGNWKTDSSAIFSKINNGLRFYTNGITGYVDVSDVVKAMINLMESEIINQRFIVSAENLSFKEVFCQIAENLEVKQPQFEANRLMLSIAWKYEWLKSKISSASPLITKESANSAMKKNYYSNEKIKNQLGFQFTPIEQTIKRITEIYKNRNEK